MAKQSMNGTRRNGRGKRKAVVISMDAAQVLLNIRESLLLAFITEGLQGTTSGGLSEELPVIIDGAIEAAGKLGYSADEAIPFIISAFRHQIPPMIEQGHLHYNDFFDAIVIAHESMKAAIDEGKGKSTKPASADVVQEEIDQVILGSCIPLLHDQIMRALCEKGLTKDAVRKILAEALATAQKFGLGSQSMSCVLIAYSNVLECDDLYVEIGEEGRKQIFAAHFETGSRNGGG